MLRCEGCYFTRQLLSSYLVATYCRYVCRSLGNSNATLALITSSCLALPCLVSPSYRERRGRKRYHQAARTRTKHFLFCFLQMIWVCGWDVPVGLLVVVVVVVCDVCLFDVCMYVCVDGWVDRHVMSVCLFCLRCFAMLCFSLPRYWVAAWVLVLDLIVSLISRSVDQMRRRYCFFVLIVTRVRMACFGFAGYVQVRQTA